MQKSKTILYLITQSELGGAQRYIFDLARNLKEECSIFVAFGEPGEAGELAKLLKENNIKYFIIPNLNRAISPWNDFLALIEITKLIKKTKPDIIHLNSSKISILGSFAFALIRIFAICRICIHLQIRIMYTVHGWVFNEPLPAWQKLFYKYAEKFTAIFKDKLICVSEFDHQIAIKEKICNPKKLITIHNGIEPITFLPKEQALYKLKQQVLPLSADSPPLQGGDRGGIGELEGVILGTIGNLYKTKGFEYLIAATKILINQDQNIKTIIIGEGSERKNLENLIKKNNLEDKIILAGKINNAAELLPAFDIYVCSSVKEGLSYTIIEAMQAGLPIVATKVGGNKELIENRKTGLLAKSRDPEDLAEKINELIKNKELRHELAKNAIIKAEEEFKLETMIKKTKEVYLNKN